MSGISETVHMRLKKLATYGYINIYQNPFRDCEKNSKIQNGRQNVKDRQQMRMAAISQTLHLRLKRLKVGPIWLAINYELLGHLCAHVD